MRGRAFIESGLLFQAHNIKLFNLSNFLLAGFRFIIILPKRPSDGVGHLSDQGRGEDGAANLFIIVLRRRLFLHKFAFQERLDIKIVNVVTRRNDGRTDGADGGCGCVIKPEMDFNTDIFMTVINWEMEIN